MFNNANATDLISPEKNIDTNLVKGGIRLTRKLYEESDVQHPEESTLDDCTSTTKNEGPDKSSSLILKQITDKIILDQVSILNFIKESGKKSKDPSKVKHQKCSIPTNNPIIKITVLPLTAEYKSSKTLLKHKYKSKEIQKTASSINNNCFHKNTQSCSRNYDKNHNIRNSSSADLFKSHKNEGNPINYSDELSVNNFSYTKRILTSLNMDKRQKIKPNLFNNDISISPRGPRYSKEGCKCDSTLVNQVLDDMNSRKSRVTIVGRVGLNKDDQYVLNCAATVDDKPIKTQFGQDYMRVPAWVEDDNGNKKSSRSTQANIAMSSERETFNNEAICNKTIQCTCNAIDVGTAISHCKFGESKEHKNPLIVISVYPTKESMEGVQYLDDIIKINSVNESQSVKSNSKAKDQNRSYKTGTNNKNFTKSNTSSTHQSINATKRSAYDKNVNNNQKTTKPKLEASTINRSITRFTKSRSPSTTRFVKSRPPSPSSRIISKEKDDNTFNKKIPRKESPGHQLPLKKTTPINNKYNKQSCVNTAQTSIRDPLKKIQGRLHEKTERNKIKKAIVDGYTEKVLQASNTKNNKNKTKNQLNNNASQVTINIDGEHEKYRVLFLQDKLSTDLSVRRTLVSPDSKPIGNWNETKNKICIQDSLEKFLMLSRERKHGKQNFARNDNQEKQIKKGVDKKLSRAKIRDSLEIGHWREGGSKQYKSVFQQKNTNTNKNKDLQDVDKFDKKDYEKHYRGDRCCVPNPAERDQEIRELLGIEKYRSRNNITQVFVTEFVNQAVQTDMHPEECVNFNNNSVSHQNESYFKDNKSTNTKPKLVTTSTQYDHTIFSEQQMVLNRNIQVFLQVGQIMKQRPIRLSRKQYEKIKKTIQKKVSNKISQERRKRCNSNSVISLGVRLRKMKRQHVSNAKIAKIVQAKFNSSIHQSEVHANVQKYNEDQTEPLPLLYPEERDTKEQDDSKASPRQVVSSLEIRYASMTHMRHVTFSSSDLKSHRSGSLLSDIKKGDKRSPSIQTIFKGHKKSVTPNLGTSAFSLYSDEELNHSKCNNLACTHNEKGKKSFLRRLMSCLLMRTAKVPDTVLPPPKRDPASLKSSNDSYHISTALGGIDMTSSLFDTSVSFYSNHTIMPIATMKRGFLSSVRGFLTNFKGR